MNQELNITFALFILRVITGALFFFQGYDKIFSIRIDNVVATFTDQLHKTLIPSTLIKPGILVTSWVEMIGGSLVTLGLFRDYSLYVLGIDLVLVAFAFSSMKAMWDMQYFFPRMVFVLALLLLPPGFDRWSLDHLLS